MKFDTEKYFIQRHRSEQFKLPGTSGFLHNVPATLIEKSDPS